MPLLFDGGKQNKLRRKSTFCSWSLFIRKTVSELNKLFNLQLPEKPSHATVPLIVRQYAKDHGKLKQVKNLNFNTRYVREKMYS
jgi:hypothetical protein